MALNSNFFAIMDQVDDYDLSLTRLSEQFGEAMISLAYLSFLNPNTSISSKGYRSTPALLKHDPATNTLHWQESP